MREEDRELPGRGFQWRHRPAGADRGAQEREWRACHRDHTVHGSSLAPASIRRSRSSLATGRRWPANWWRSISRRRRPIAVSFLQGCAGDVNSKGMFRGDVELSRKYGRMLAESYIKALDKLQPSCPAGNGVHGGESARIPARTAAFRGRYCRPRSRRWRTSCGAPPPVMRTPCTASGTTIPANSRPTYRGKLVETMLPWSKWALNMRQTGQADTVASHLEVEISRAASRRCRHRRHAVRAVSGHRPPDARGLAAAAHHSLRLHECLVWLSHRRPEHQCRDGDYMSAHYRYSRFRPPYAKARGRRARRQGRRNPQPLRQPWEFPLNPSTRSAPDSQIDADVILGYRYPGDTHADAHRRSRRSSASGSIIYADTIIGHRFQCGHQVLIRAEVIIGDRCVVHHKCTLEGRLRIGDGVKIMAHVYLPSRTVIGEHGLHRPGHHLPECDAIPCAGRRAGGARIEDHVTIGGGVTICPGVTIGRGSFIAAGSLVNKDVPPDTLAYGVPAKHQPFPEGSLPAATCPNSSCRRRTSSARSTTIRGKMNLLSPR